MAIIRVTKDSVIKPGQFVCFSSLMSDALCGRPMCVSRIVGSRVYFTDREGDSEEYRSAKTAVFLCDTKEEGAALFALIRAQHHGFKVAVAALEAKFESDTSEKLALLMQA